MSSFQREANKRRVKPVESQVPLVEFDLEESSDDSDFRIEDHVEESDDDSIDSTEGKDDDASELDSEEDSEELSEDDNIKRLKLQTGELSVADVIQEARNRKSDNKLQFDKDTKVLICCGCLGDRSDDINEIVECDGCGVTVHEACYGVSDTGSIVSTESDCPTEPWFCEACRAGVMNPTCELCPNTGGIFKETDVGKWVHLVCALYVPGVAFGEVDHLSSVTLFEMPYNKWGAKTCCLCEDERFARTGVCIGCDAGMCRTYFHVTCAQREGFLSEAHSEEVDQADPFYAHCKMHSDKTLVRRRKRNWLALQLRTQQRRLEYEQDGYNDTPEQLRIQRKLKKHRQKFLTHKTLKSPPWVPTQKMPRLLTTSASACKKLLRKAELMGIDTVALEMQEAQVAALMDVRKKWHIPPAFSVEFIAYYLDRNDRLRVMKSNLEELLHANTRLLEEQQSLRLKYDKMMKESADESRVNITLKQTVHKYHSAILSACPTKNLPTIDDLGKPPAPKVVQAVMAVPTAAALKMGVGFPLNNITAGRLDTTRVLSSHAARQDPLLLNECGICRQRRDQHLLAKCDTCHLYYHLNCLNPPLSRLPKKSKLYGWQCSECDKSSDSEVDMKEKGSRRSRSRHSKETVELQSEVFTPKVKIKPLEPYPTQHNPPTNVQGNHVSDNYSYSNVNYTNSITSVITPNPSGFAGCSTGNTQLVCTTSVTSPPLRNSLDSQTIVQRSGKKRRRDKHRSRYSPDPSNPSKEHKRKRKKKSLDVENPNITHPRITIKIKSIPMPAGEVASTSNPQCFYVPNENNEIPRAVIYPPPQELPPQLSVVSNISNVPNVPSVASIPNVSTIANVSTISNVTTVSNPRLPAKKPKEGDLMTKCDVCNQQGTNQNLVRCDECQKCYHFTCLEPPVKKSPKRRGYSWHCADCDPTEIESN